MSVRLYGRTLGNGSHATVTAGFRAALQEAGLLEGLVELDRKHAPDTPEPGGALAAHGVLTGMLAACGTLSQNARHQRRWAMVAPNSDRIPEDLAAMLWRQCTDLMVPSRWARDALVSQYERLSGAEWQTGDRRIVVVPHGVAADFRVQESLRMNAREQYADEMFFVAHLATSERERKSTLPLAQAWIRAMNKGALPPRAQLDLILDAEALSALRVELAEAGLAAAESVALHSRVDLAPRDMAWSLSHAHVVCQPSRGEGFGLTPLEARACGVPVVATGCTGHSEHLSAGMPGVVLVEHGPLAPIDDLPGAQAPAVSSEAIEAALVTAYAEWTTLDSEARGAAGLVRAEWSWPNKLGQWLSQLRD